MKEITHNPFAELLSLETVKRPVRKSRLAHYMAEYYVSHGIKADFQKRRKVLEQAWDAMTEEERAERGSLELPEPVAMRAELTRSYMNAESEEFLERLDEDNEVEYQRRLAVYEKDKKSATTPQEYHQYVYFALRS